MPPRVLLLATKDTIAYQPSRSAVASGADLLATIPAARRPTAQVTVEDVMAEPSWDTSPATMLSLARRARAAILDDGFDGVVITHGIDTLEDTAFLTDLTAGQATTEGGIVFTGATRHLDDPSTDGPGNLTAALAAATHPALRHTGVVACLNDELHAARWVHAADTTSVAALRSYPYPPLGRVVDGQVELLAVPPPRPPAAAGEPESDVALIKTYPGIEPTLLTTVADAGARGIVLEGTGESNVPVNLFSTISDLTEWDIPVVIASRCRTRGVPLEHTPTGTGMAAAIGAIGARGLAPTKARAALMVALGSGGVPAVRDWFSRL
ncbi:asparaginase [Rugosimonospora africana]|uniref:L-asparaginase n=1 Tax=Rugosimonospora africana TaxID=556532 RepID=A0A8J3QZD6_9ACTN|nr:asparaginase [Rugosimonospora africana]GIH20089.1 L-asparaginase [Rugosimonospora africana]